MLAIVSVYPDPRAAEATATVVAAVVVGGVSWWKEERLK